jgi:hypothetical protein
MIGSVDRQQSADMIQDGENIQSTILQSIRYV